MLSTPQVVFTAISMSHFSFFFFKCSAAPRHLPSSPPRPSPVLPPPLDHAHQFFKFAQQLDQASKLVRRELMFLRAGVSVADDQLRSFQPKVRQRLLHLPLVRSEEHTSELQSPCNLVCRLLLEKK